MILHLKWIKNCILVAGTETNQAPNLKISDANLYVLVATLAAQNKVKLLKQLESGFKRTINWKKHLPNKTPEAQNRYLNVLINPSFQGVNRLFVLSFKDVDGRESHKQYHLPTVEINNHNVLIDGRNFIDQPIKHDFKKFDNIRKTATGQGHDYPTEYLLDYHYFKNNYDLISVDISILKNLDADPKAVQKIDFN